MSGAGWWWWRWVNKKVGTQRSIRIPVGKASICQSLSPSLTNFLWLKPGEGGKAHDRFSTRSTCERASDTGKTLQMFPLEEGTTQWRHKARYHR